MSFFASHFLGNEWALVVLYFGALYVEPLLELVLDRVKALWPPS
jgi:hypothetical protein